MLWHSKKILHVEHFAKSIRIWSFSGPYFPVFSLNAGKYGPEKLRIRTLWRSEKFRLLKGVVISDNEEG